MENVKKVSNLPTYFNFYRPVRANLNNKLIGMKNHVRTIIKGHIPRCSSLGTYDHKNCAVKDFLFIFLPNTNSNSPTEPLAECSTPLKSQEIDKQPLYLVKDKNKDFNFAKPVLKDGKAHIVVQDSESLIFVCPIKKPLVQEFTNTEILKAKCINGQWNMSSKMFKKELSEKLPDQECEQQITFTTKERKKGSCAENTKIYEIGVHVCLYSLPLFRIHYLRRSLILERLFPGISKTEINLWYEDCNTWQSVGKIEERNIIFKCQRTENHGMKNLADHFLIQIIFSQSTYWFPLYRVCFNIVNKFVIYATHTVYGASTRVRQTGIIESTKFKYGTEYDYDKGTINPESSYKLVTQG